MTLILLNDDAHDGHSDGDGHVDDDGDAIQNCRISEYIELCAQIGMMMMILMQFKIAEYQNL